MAKLKVTKHDDQLLLALLAVVFAAAAVIFLKAGDLANILWWGNKSETVQVLGAETPDELMRSLNTTNDDGGATDFSQLRNDIKGL